LRSDETNVVGKEKEDGGENGRAKVVKVVVDVLLWDGDALYDGVGGGRVVRERIVRGIGCICHIATAQPEEGERGGRFVVCRPFRGENVGPFGERLGIFGDPRWLGQKGSRLRGAREGLVWGG
jgi:hypothetical protein